MWGHSFITSRIFGNFNRSLPCHILLITSHLTNSFVAIDSSWNNSGWITQS